MKALNGKLADFDPKELMEKVKANGSSLFTERECGEMVYDISIHFQELFGVVSDDTKYWFDIIAEDANGDQQRLTSYEESTDLSESEVVSKLAAFKEKTLKAEQQRVLGMLVKLAYSD